MTTATPFFHSIIKPGTVLQRRAVPGDPGLIIRAVSVCDAPAAPGHRLVTDRLGRVHRVYVGDPERHPGRVEFHSHAETWYVSDTPPAL